MKRPGQAAGIVEIVWAGRGFVEDMGSRSLAMVGPANWGDHSMEMQPCETPVSGEVGESVHITTQAAVEWSAKKTFRSANVRMPMDGFEARESSNFPKT